MEDKKFNWKEHFKKSFKELLKELLFMLCILISAVLVFFTQTNKQLSIIGELFNSGDWIIIVLILFGLLGISVVVEKILKIIFWLVSTPFITWYKRKYR